MRLRLALAVGLCAAAAARPASAAGSITHGAVTLTYPASHWSANPVADLVGTENTPGADPIVAMGWWYRVEGDTREYPLPPPDSETYHPDGRLVAVWNNLDGKNFQVEETTYVFDRERPSGAVYSKLEVRNDGAPRAFVAFHYLDASAGGTAGGDSGQAPTHRFLKFTDGIHTVRHSSISASGFVVRSSPLLRNLLNDALPTDLDESGLPAGPGDLESALGWEISSMPTGGGALLMVLVSSRLAGDHTAGAYLNVLPQPGLVMRYASGGTGWVHRGFRGTAALSSEAFGAASPDGFEFVTLDDFDGDLRDDNLAHNPTTGELRFNYWTPLSGATPPPPNWRVSATGDFNADGKADLLWRNVESQKLSVWFMNGPQRLGAAAPTPDQAAHANWNVVGAADFNADGANDLLWYNQTSGNIVVWYLNAALQRVTGAFTTPASVGALNWRAVAVGDFGKGSGTSAVWNAPDIVWQNDTSRKIVVWHMDHTGTRTSGVFTTPDSLGAYIIVGPR